MKVHLEDTTSAQVARELNELRARTGSSALSRVLTLVVVVPSEGDVEAAIEAADGASLAHPCRVVVVADDVEDGTNLNAEIRAGESAGMSDIAILHPSTAASEDLASLVTPLLLPDAPLVVWWAHDVPENPHETTLGKIADRRLTTSTTCGDPVNTLLRLADFYEPGDTDLAWSGATLWRGYLAALLDEPPYEPVTSVKVKGSLRHPTTWLLAAWLRLRLKCGVTMEDSESDFVESVVMTRDSGDIALHRQPGETTASFVRPGRPDQVVPLPIRTTEAKLVEELRRMNPDQAYAEVLAAFAEHERGAKAT